MKEKIKMLVELLGISEAQGAYLVRRYFSKGEMKDIYSFIEFYHKTCLERGLVGTSYEKASACCVLLERELITRFENMDEFVIWLKDNFKGHYFYETDEKGIKIVETTKNKKTGELIKEESFNCLQYTKIGLDKWGNFIYDGYEDIKELLSFWQERHEDLIKQALFSLLFKRQREFKKLDFARVAERKARAYIDADAYERHYLELKEANNKLYDKNIAEFEKRLNYELARL